MLLCLFHSIIITDYILEAINYSAQMTRGAAGKKLVLISPVEFPRTFRS
jgi:hypothetical protein